MGAVNERGEVDDGNARGNESCFKKLGKEPVGPREN